MATVDEFAKITRKVIAKEGFDDYLPTALYPSRKEVLVLEGVPKGSDLEPIVLSWASKSAHGDEEFLVAFKIAPTKFKVIRRHAGRQEEKVFSVVRKDA